MVIVMKCTCGKLLDVDEQHHGERGQCPWCGNQFTVGDVVSLTTAMQSGPGRSNTVQRESAAEMNLQAGDVRANAWICNPVSNYPVSCLLISVIVLVGGGALSYLMLQPDESKTDIARSTVKGSLTTACEQFSLRRGRFPKDLEELLQEDEFGGPHLKSRDFLFDPWWQPYQYDPKGPRNSGRVPDIWTVAPKGSEIGNWPTGR